eukprot:CAMPEP_0183813558 /NCGR_PEP_ID=MMETSP0803_2-20130417/53306_1 /TAXON_ID=195967 /ORGANISM="Crustomastix stigmata, Strain CCMP3273" /LENGTH=44 /DNA_ID= /DNA_START= /DNA_END= /DNA_ORIENTATION=
MSLDQHCQHATWPHAPDSYGAEGFCAHSTHSPPAGGACCCALAG